MTAFSSMRLLGSEGSGSQAHEPEMQEEACEAQGTQTRTCLRRSGTHKELGALNSTGAAAPSSLPQRALPRAPRAPRPPRCSASSAEGAVVSVSQVCLSAAHCLSSKLCSRGNGEEVISPTVGRRQRWMGRQLCA